jgi:60 kDa SS-A/Ro ribonucleoprotein
MSHPKATTPEMNVLFKWCVEQETTIPVYDGQLRFLSLIGASESTIIDAILRYGIVREQIPTEHLNSLAVWEALLEKMPMEAMLRNLAKMSSIGLLKGKNLNTVVDRLADENIVKKSKFHPLKVLAAWKTYSQGHGEKGNLSWKPEKLIEDALQNVTFYHAFKTIVPSGKRLLLGLDVSGSMTWEVGFGGFDARTISAVMAMATVRTETCKTMAFSNTFMELNLKPDDNLYQVTQKISGLPFSSTDCSLPMVWALKNNIPVDCFVIYTDSETNTGHSPKRALDEYRQKMGIEAKQIVVGITATNVTVADPNDPLTMDVAGFDAGCPAAISAFSKG